MFSKQNISNNLNKVRQNKPLVHHITNQVTISECANITLCFGALPVMAHSLEEVADMVALAGSLVLNIGTLTPTQVQAMIKAGKRANQLNIPVILDPVGAGATELRTKSALNILSEVKVSILKGNAAEIAVLAGLDAVVRGVEAAEVEGNLVEGAKLLAEKYDLVVAATGVEDLVTDGKRLAWVENGHPLMGRVVGTGCMGASVVGVFAAVESDYFLATLSALTCFGIAGELAAGEGRLGPGTFKTNLFDSAALLTAEQVEKLSKIRMV